MNAITLGREIDPDGADRVIGSGLDSEGFMSVNPLEMIVRVIAVSWIPANPGYLQCAYGRRLFFTPNGRGIESDKRV